MNIHVPSTCTKRFTLKNRTVDLLELIFFKNELTNFQFVFIDHKIHVPTYMYMYTMSVHNLSCQIIQ